MAFDEERSSGNIEEHVSEDTPDTLTWALAEENAQLRARVKKLEDLLENFDHCLRKQGLIDDSFPKPVRTII